MNRIKIYFEKKLNNFDLRIDIESSSKFIGILGESGMGKSMTLKCIAGIETPDKGEIKYNSNTFFSLKEDNPKNKINMNPQKRRVGYMFQNYALFPTMTVYENVYAGIRDLAEKSKLTKEYLERFNLSEISDEYPRNISGGQKQRVALARILIGKPDVILLDEPFSALDFTMKDKMQRELKAYLDDYDGTVIMVSHNRDEIFRFSDEIFVIKDGKIIESQETKELFRNPIKKDTARLTGCKNIVKLNRINEHNAYIPDWNLNIACGKIIPEGTEFLGYRAHDFELIFDESDLIYEEKNVIKVSIKEMAELPFETNLYFNVDSDKKTENESVSCIVQRNRLGELNKKGMPVALRLIDDKMLFLKE